MAHGFSSFTLQSKKTHEVTSSGRSTRSGTGPSEGAVVSVVKVALLGGGIFTNSSEQWGGVGGV